MDSGRAVDPHDGVVAAPDGSLWMTDLNCIMRLNEQGEIATTLGLRPDTILLREIASLAHDRAGHLYAFDEQSKIVHVFNPDGTPAGTRSLSPEELSADVEVLGMSVAHDGAVAIATSREAGIGDSRVYLCFDAQGRRLAPLSLDIDSVSEDWLRDPRQPRGWVLGYTEVTKVGYGGQPDGMLTRRPNDKHLERVDNGAIAPDGSLALTVGGLNWGRSPSAVCFYDASGKPKDMVDMPYDMYFSVAYDGRRAYLSQGSTILVAAPGEPIRRFTPTANDGEEPFWNVMLAPNGQELWLWESEAMTIRRYRLAN